MDLLEKLKQATVPDRALDGELLRAFGGIEWESAVSRASLPSGCPREIAEREALNYAPAYTGSLDAALRLLPGNWSWRVGNLPSGAGWASLGTQKSLQEIDGGSPALALCIACVIARLGAGQASPP